MQTIILTANVDHKKIQRRIDYLKRNMQTLI